MIILPDIIEKFVSKEMCDLLYKNLSTFAPVDSNGYSNIYVSETNCEPTDEYFFNKLDILNKEHVVLKDIIDLIQKAACSNFNFKKTDMSLDRINFRTFKDGQYFPYHFDQNGEGGIIYTALLYLNNNYEGGEIVFYDEDFGTEGPFEAFKPEAGTLFCFMGDNSPHEVLPVLGGERANIAMNFRLWDKKD